MLTDSLVSAVALDQHRSQRGPCAGTASLGSEGPGVGCRGGFGSTRGAAQTQTTQDINTDYRERGQKILSVQYCGLFHETSICLPGAGAV